MSTGDSSAFVSHSFHCRGHGGGGEHGERSEGHGVHSHYFKNWGHVEANCRIKARELSRLVNMVQVTTFASSITISTVESPVILWLSLVIL